MEKTAPFRIELTEQRIGDLWIAVENQAVALRHPGYPPYLWITLWVACF